MAYKRKYRKYKKFYRKSRGKYNQGRKSFQARVRKAILKAAETKYLMSSAESTSLYHDRGTSSAGATTTNEGALIFNPWYSITRGTSISNRIGDEVIARGMALRLMYLTTSDRPAQFVRIIIAVIPKTSGTTVHDGSNYDLMDSAGSNDTVTGMVKREGVKVLYDKTTTLTVQGVKAVPVTGDNRLFKKLYIKSKKGSNLKWQQDGTLANKPVGVWVIPYDQYGSIRTDICGYISYTYKLYFKDV